MNNIGGLTIGEGYQVKMNEENTLVVSGSLIPYDTSFNLNSGWNIMGYLHQESYDVAFMMSSMNINNLIILKDESGFVYWPQFSLNSIGNMNPGKGYQAKLAGPWTFSFPAGDAGRYGDIYVERPVHFEEPINTGNNMIIGFPLESWKSTPSIGDEITAYDEDGKLIGSTTFKEIILLFLYGEMI